MREWIVRLYGAICCIGIQSEENTHRYEGALWRQTLIKQSFTVKVTPSRQVRLKRASRDLGLELWTEVGAEESGVGSSWAGSQKGKRVNGGGWLFQIQQGHKSDRHPILHACES